jgi:pimeloyl-ACP methyl ester carboxylesterase
MSSLVSAAAPAYWEQFSAELPSGGVRTGTITASDSLPLRAFELGHPDTPPLVILNPLGTPFLLLLPFARHLASRYRVVSWELRGSPFLEEGRISQSVGIERQAADLAEVTQALGIRRFHLLTWCIGATIAAWAKSTLPLELMSVSTLAPSRVSDLTYPSRVQTVLLPLLERIIQADDAGNDVTYLCELVRTGAAEGHARIGSGRLLQELTCVNLRTAASIVTFAGLLRDFNASMRRCVGSDATVRLFVELQKSAPSFLLHCRDDHVVDYRCSVEVAEKSRSCQLRLYPKGGHFVPFLMPEQVAGDVLAFLQSQPQEA